MDSLKFHPGLPCPTPLHLALQGRRPASVFYPFGHSTPCAYAIQPFSISHSLILPFPTPIWDRSIFLDTEKHGGLHWLKFPQTLDSSPSAPSAPASSLPPRLFLQPHPYIERHPSWPVSPNIPRQARTAWGIQGGRRRPQATPETAIRPFRGWLARRA
jgi:hypothetical protein